MSRAIIISRFIERLFVKILFFGSGTILALPLIVTESALFPYVISKALLFRIIVEIMGVCWAVLCIYRSSYRPDIRNPLIVAPIAMVAVALLATITSQDPWYSLWSVQERMSGSFFYVHVWLWFLILTSACKEWSAWRALLRTTIAISFVVILYGIGQRLHLQFLPPDPDQNRFAASLGNPIYLGVYAFFHVYLSAYLAVRERHNLWKVFAIVGVAANAVVLLFSASRGVTLALAATVVLFLITLCWMIPKPSVQKIYRRGVIAFFVTSVGLFFLFQLPIGHRVAKTYFPPFVNKVLYSSFDDPNRLALWKVGLLGFRDKPILGWGWESFAMVNDIYAPSRLTPDSSPWNDRAHNQLIDMLVFSGIIGVSAYVFFWYAVGRTLVRLRSLSKSFRHMVLSLVLALLFVGYFLQNITAFDTPINLIFLSFSLALLYFTHTDAATSEPLTTPQKVSRKNERQLVEREFNTALPWHSGICFVVGACIVGASIYWLHAVPFKKSQNIISAVTILPVDVSAALGLLRESLNSRSFTNIEAREQMADFIDRIVEHPGFSEETKKEYVLFTADEALKSVSEHPKYLRYYLRAAYMQRLASRYDPAAKERAAEIAIKARDAYPDRYEPYLELAEIASLKGNKEDIIKNGKEMAKRDPRKSRSLWYLAWLYARTGDSAGMVKSMEEAIMRDCRIAQYADHIYLISEIMPSVPDPFLVQLYTDLAVMGPAGDYRLKIARQHVIDKVSAAMAREAQKRIAAQRRR